VIRFLITVLALATLGASTAQVTPKRFGGSFDSWAAAGNTNLFTPVNEGIRVDWDSSQTNSYYYLPLGLTLTRADDFELSFVMRLEALQLGTTPGKEDTFEIGAGLLNLTNALNPEFFRGAGINAQHGPRNLVELDYFPASGFISATVAPTIATANNQILFSDNHPVELELGTYYKVVMSFTATNQTLRSQLLKGDANFTFLDPFSLKSLILSSNYGDFAVDTLALINYNDEGQIPPQFAGSLRGSGNFWDVEVIVHNRPAMEIREKGGEIRITFETSIGWSYQLESQTEDGAWNAAGAPILGTGNPVEAKIAERSRLALFRVSATRL
jgi:hypothetical protein